MKKCYNISDSSVLPASHFSPFVPSGVPRIFFPGVISTNSVEDRGQREQECGGGRPLVRGSTQFANEWNLYSGYGLFSTELGIRLSFINISEFRGGGGGVWTSSLVCHCVFLPPGLKCIVYNPTNIACTCLAKINILTSCGNKSQSTFLVRILHNSNSMFLLKFIQLIGECV
jgi:hypothetical protein